jgi:hypothetical protein
LGGAGAVSFLALLPETWLVTNPRPLLIYKALFLKSATSQVGMRQPKYRHGLLLWSSETRPYGRPVNGLLYFMPINAAGISIANEQCVERSGGLCDPPHWVLPKSVCHPWNLEQYGYIC